MKTCLIRHGETDWNSLGKYQGRENIPLNEIGIKQMEETAQYLNQIHWDKIITSPLQRAKASAEIISKSLGIENSIEEIDFVERDYGKISGMTMEEANNKFQDGKYNENDIEPYKILKRRSYNALMKWIKEFKGSNIIIVSHGAVINSILSKISKGKIGTGKTKLKNACMTLLEIEDDRINILFYNKNANELQPPSNSMQAIPADPEAPPLLLG
jgi:uncharacterized phosphatase